MLRPILRKALGAAKSPSAIYILASVLGRAVAVLLVPLYTRKLTPVEYGTYGLFTSLLGLLPTIFSLGLNAGLNKAYFDEKDERNGRSAFGAVARGILLLAGAWTIVGIAVALVFPQELLAPLARRHVVLLVLGGWGTCAAGAAEYFFRIRERAYIAAAFPLVNFAVTVSLGLALAVQWNRGLNGAVEAPSIAALVVGIASAIYLLATFRTGETLKATRRALVYSLPFVPRLLASWLQIAGDRWVLDVFGTGHVVGPYFLATQLMSPVPIVLAAWNNGQWPAMGRTYRDEGLPALKARLWMYERRALLLAGGTAIALGMAMPILRLLVGPRFLPAFGYMPAIAVAQVLAATYYPDSTVMFYAGRSKRIVTMSAAFTALGLGLSAALLRPFGVTGLLAARIFASLIQMTAFMAIARRVTLALSTQRSSEKADAAA